MAAPLVDFFCDENDESAEAGGSGAADPEATDERGDARATGLGGFESDEAFLVSDAFVLAPFVQADHVGLVSLCFDLAIESGEVCVNLSL
jgi:hypothetical protein